MCLLSILDSLTVPKIKEGNSDSVLIFGKHKKYGKVALKLSLEDTNHDNSMSNERDIYMFVKKKITKLTPHFVGGIEVGQCKMSTIKKKSILDAIYKLRKNNNSQIIYYVLLPRLNGKSLESILIKKTQLSLDFDIDIAIQVAQALCVAEKFKFSHHDLKLGNIFIETLTKKTKINYKYPFAFELDTKFKVFIFDYDLASIQPNFKNNALSNGLCSSHGLCNQYLKNEDWRYFLFNFVNFIEFSRPTPLRAIIGGLFGNDDEGKNYIAFGRACVKKNQNKCQLDKKTLQKMISPLAFLNEQIEE